MSTLRSPNEMLASAKEIMLDGREPESERDWQMIVNFFAANIARGLEEPACLLLAKIYSIPIADEAIKEIAAFQARAKAQSE